MCSRILPGGGNTSWDDIVGQEEVKRLLEQLVIWPTIAPHMFQVGASSSILSQDIMSQAGSWALEQAVGHCNSVFVQQLHCVRE